MPLPNWERMNAKKRINIQIHKIRKERDRIPRFAEENFMIVAEV